MLPDYLKKIKRLAANNRNDLYVALIIVLVSIISFGLGRLSVLWPNKEPITIQAQTNADTGQAQTNADKLPRDSASSQRESAAGNFVASKNGTAYHYPWCSSALKIKDENKIWFESKEEAEKAGYKPAGNCPGL